ELDAQTLRQRLYTRREQLAEGDLPVPLKLLHINRCPVVAPLSVLRPHDLARLQLNLDECQARAKLLRDAQPQWQAKLTDIYAEEEFAAVADPEQQLYAGFLGERDRRLCEQVRQASAQQLAQDNWAFADERLPELLFRYRARNFPNSLSVEEVERWQYFCQERLSNPAAGAPITLAQFDQALAHEWPQANALQQQVLQHWQDYVQKLRAMGQVC
ncbi:MAG TPA: exodeoxyribonuclease I, partial [Xanthomonadales bacterium]|nr:exodeoxyribonuclease I [Xanthomonadales bacterium]